MLVSALALSLSTALVAARPADSSAATGGAAETAAAKIDMLCGRDDMTGSNRTKRRAAEQAEAKKAAAERNPSRSLGGSNATSGTGKCS